MSKEEHPDYFSGYLRSFDSTEVVAPDRSMAALDSAYYAFPQPGVVDKVNWLARKWSYYYFEKENYITAIAYADSILLLVKDRIEEEKFAVMYANALFDKGSCYYRLKNYDETLHYYLLGNEVVASYISDKCLIREYYGNMGFLMYAQGKFLLAAQYFKRDYEEQLLCSTKTFERFGIIQRNMANVGLCYYSLGMYDSAYIYYNKGLFFIAQNWEAYNADQSPDIILRATAVLQGYLADILGMRGQYAAAEILFAKCLDVLKNFDEGFCQKTIAKKTDMYVRSNQVEKAERAFVELDSALSRKKNNEVQLLAYRTKADFYANQHRNKLFFEYSQKYLLLKDSMAAAIKDFAAKDISKTFETNEQRVINENLAHDNELKSVYLSVAIIALIMSLAIILLVWQSLRRSGKHLKDLKKLNKVVSNKNTELQRAFNALEKSHNENSRITRIVAHDLRNPISSIHNITYSLLKKEQPLHVKEILELIKMGCTNSIDLIRDLLGTGENQEALNIEMVNMGRLLEYCMGLLQAKADEKKQQLKLYAEEVVIEGNRQKLWRVVSNVVNNAIKFSPHNSSIRLKLEKRPNSVLLSVQDYGIGIPVEMTEKIFSITPSPGRLGTSGEESYGMGLSISRKIVEEHNGRIWFESILGLGTTFYIELPA